MTIIHVTSEFFPLAKVGGLGDVVHGLSQRQHEDGDHPEIFLPYYQKIIDPTYIQKAHIHHAENAPIPYEVHQIIVEHLPIHLFLLLDRSFDRDSIYGQENDNRRFFHFCLAVEHYIQTKFLEKKLLLHLHDWPTAILAYLLPNTPTVLSIHNIEHQGRCSAALFHQAGISYSESEVNFLKIGIEYAKAVVTVSPSYREEILTPGFGFGLDEFLLRHKDKIYGIINGISEKIYNPYQDPYLKNPLQSDSLSDLLLFKGQAKKQLQKMLKKPFTLPLVVTISRLVHQKGIFLMQALAEKAKDLNISYLVIGLPSSADIWESFQKIREQNQDSPYVHIFLEFHQALSHVTFAAADFIFIPSIFEPCGLTQMIGIRYKTFPIVRKTGGLQDTVFDFDDAKIPIKKRCGFVFKNPVNQEMLETMQRALQFYQDKSRFQEGLQHLSSHTFSWEKPCKEYRRIYQKIMNV